VAKKRIVELENSVKWFLVIENDWKGLGVIETS
jgi:hypothetical protein